jgi:hypothetical protein
VVAGRSGARTNGGDVVAGTLKVDTSTVREAGRQIEFVAREFDSAERIADDYAERAGHPDVAHELQRFADTWDDHRKDLLEAIGGLGEAAIACADAYEQTEAELTKALRETAEL